MSFKPISGALLQYQKSNGDLASGFYLAMEADGTSTDINMYTDNTGGTALARCQLNTKGYPIVSSESTEFVIHTDQDYKLSLYPTLADAQAKTNAEWTVDSLIPIGDTSTTENLTFAENEDDFAAGVAAAAGKELVVSTVLVVAANITPAGLTIRFIQGGKLSPNLGITITLNCDVTAGLYEIFDSTAAGTVKGDFNEGYPNIRWWGIDNTGATNDTTAANAILATQDRLLFTEGTYLGTYIVTLTKTTIRMEGSPVLKTPGSQSSNNVSSLKIATTATKCTIDGVLTLDGNAANNTPTGSGGTVTFTTTRIGNLHITASDFTVNGDTFLNNSFGDGMTAWDGVSVDSGAQIDRIRMKNITWTNTGGHAAYWWAPRDYSLGRCTLILGDQSSQFQDRRFRFGTQSGSSQSCLNGSVEAFIDHSVVFESRTVGCDVGFIGGEVSPGGKIEDGQNIHIKHIRIATAGSPSGTVAPFIINAEFDAVGSRGIVIDLWEVIGFEVGGSFPLVSIEGNAASSPAEDVIVGTLIVKDCTGGQALRLRDSKNVTIRKCILDNDGGSVTTGLFEEGSHTRNNVVIEDLYSSGHTTDWDSNDGGIKVLRSFPADMVRTLNAHNIFSDGIFGFPSITVGPDSGADFDNLEKAFLRASETHPLYDLNSQNSSSKFIIKLQGTFDWSGATNDIVLAGGNWSFIEIQVISGTITLGGSVNLKLTNGAIGPIINGGAYDKEGNGSSFIDLDTNSNCSFKAATLVNNIAACFNVSSGSHLDLTNTSVTKDAGATALAAHININGGTVSAVNATLPYVTVNNGSKMDMLGGTITGSSNVTVNTFNAPEGVINI